VIVVFDVGNSEITIGTFQGVELISHWRLTTAAPRTADEMSLLIRSITGSEAGSRSGIQGSAIASVVPAITPVLAEACVASFGRTPVIVDGRAKLPIKLDVEEPFTVGADRIANTLAASQLHKRDAIVVDLGTATTYDCITADGTFLGRADLGYPELGLLMEFDGLAKYTKLCTWHVELFAYLVEKMRNTPDGDGTLLDNSLVVYGSPMGNPNLHNHKRCPLFLAGRAGGQMKGGRHVRAADGTPMANVFLSVLHTLGLDDVATFGDSNGELGI